MAETPRLQRDYTCREVVELASDYLEGAMTPQQMTAVRGASESSATAASPSSTRSGQPPRLPASCGKNRSLTRSRTSCSRRSRTGSANEGVQVPHRERPGGVQPFCLAAARTGAQGRGSSPRSSRAAPASTPAGEATCRTGSHPLCTRSSSTARSTSRRSRWSHHEDGCVRRIDAWNTTAREAYGRMCIARAHELVAAAPERLDGWAPPPEIAPESARVGYIAARIAEELGGVEAHLEERRRQSEWLVAQLELE